MTDIIANIENVNGELVVSSKVIAEQFNKQHSHVLIQKYQPKYNNDLLEKFEFELPEIKL